MRLKILPCSRIALQLLLLFIFFEFFGRPFIKTFLAKEVIIYMSTRSLGALRAPTSRLRPFGPALGPSGLLDFVLPALRALRPSDPRNGAIKINTLSHHCTDAWVTQPERPKGVKDVVKQAQRAET